MLEIGMRDGRTGKREDIDDALVPCGSVTCGPAAEDERSPIKRYARPASPPGGRNLSHASPGFWCGAARHHGGYRVFLILQAIPALKADTTNFLTTPNWAPDSTPSSFGIAALAFGSLLTSLLALVMSVPVAVGVALAISHYSPRWLAGPLAYVVDLLAAVPSVVFGLWGLIYLV